MIAVQALPPVGLLVEGRGDVRQLGAERLREWIDGERLLVLRGFDALSEKDFLSFCRTFPYGQTVDWSFGSVLELEEKADTQNYLFSAEKVPFHWDGAFHVVPHVLCFQCLDACESPGGETLFASGEMLWESASQQDRDEWRRIYLTYTTDKKAHYGGEFRSSLVAKHPRHRTPVVRFAEPVPTEKNPVTLEMSGLDEQALAFHANRIVDRLYDPAFRYAHRWKTGDYVFADNLALLHARTEFRSGDHRKIRRVQLRFEDWGME